MPRGRPLPVLLDPVRSVLLQWQPWEVGPIRVDYHVHSRFSADGTSTLEECCAAAARQGLTEICFTEHLDLNPAIPVNGWLDPAGYAEAVGRVRDTQPLTVLMGLEIGFDREYHPAIRRYLETHVLPWDFLLGSVHLADGEMIDVPFFHTRDRRSAYLAYFKELEAAVRAAVEERLFDVIGHFDFVKRYLPACLGPFRLDDCRDLAEQVLRLAAEGGIGLEINTSGLRGPLGETLPTLETLRRFRQLGGEVLTIGADSHHASEVGTGTAAALELAQAAGFRAITTFRERRPCWVKI